MNFIFGIGVPDYSPGDGDAPAVLPPGGWNAVWYVTKRILGW